MGFGAGASGDEAATAGESPEPAPTVTVTAEPEIVEVDPSEDLLAELAEREAELEHQAAELDDRATELDEREAGLDEREESLATTEDAIAENTIPGSGIFLVGEDIQPGTYRGDGSSGTCYWARLSGTGGGLGDIIANDLPAGPTVVTISPSDVAFETSGCADWVRQ